MPLPAAPNPVLVSDVTGLRKAVTAATPGTTIELADGTYTLAAPTLAILTPGVTLRSRSDNPAAVVLTGSIAPLMRIEASNVTIASVTFARAPSVAVAVVPTISANILGDTIYNVTFDDDGGPAVRLTAYNALAASGPYADDGTLACSRFHDTTAVDHCAATQLGIDALAVRGWTIRDNTFDHLACPTRLIRTIMIRGGSRDNQVTNNHLLDSNGNILIGNDPAQPARSYSDYVQPSECSGLGAAPPQDWGSIACNNTIAGLGAPMYAATGYFDDGIALWGACDTWALHNTVVSPAGAATAHDIEYRYAGTFVHLVNNLVEAAPASRDAGTQDPVYASSNVQYMGTSDFVDPLTGDLHLSATAMETAGTSIDGLAKCQTDADGKMRPLAAPLVGAYER